MANTNGFNLEVNTILNTRDVPKQLNELSAKLVKSTTTKVQIPIEINAETGSHTLKNFIKEVNVYKDKFKNVFQEVKIVDPKTNAIFSDSIKKIQEFSEGIKVLTTETHKWTDSSGAIQKWTTTVDSAGQVISKRTKEYSDGLGNLITETTNWGRNSKGQWEQIGETVRNITDDVKQATTVISTETHKWTDTSGAIQKWVTTVDDAGNVVSNRTKQYKNDIGELVTETTKWTKNEQGQWQQVGETIKTVTDDYKQATNIISTETQKFVDSKGAVQTWVTTIDDAGNKVSTRTKEIVDSMGRITQTTSKFVTEGGKLKKVGDDVVKISNILTDVTTTTTKSFGQITDTIDGVTKTFNGTITTIKKVQSDGQVLITEIGKYINEAGQAVEVTKQLNKEGIQVGTTQRKITQDLTNTGNALKSTSKNVDIVKNSAGEIVETIVTINEQGERLRTTITTSDNGLGRLTTTTRVYNETLQKEVSLHQESVNNQVKEQEALEQQNRLKQQLLTTTTQEEHIITRNNQALWATVTTTKEQTHEYGEVTTKVIQYTDALGNLVTETTKEDAQGRALAQSTKTVEQQMNKTADATNRMGDATKNGSTGVKTLGNSFASALSQLTRFYIASLPLRTVTKIISETVQAVKDFDAAITEMGKVSDLNGEKLRKYTEDLGNLGKEVARTRTEMVEGATGWLKAGYSEEDAAILAKFSALLQNTADEELSAAEATSILVSQLKAYHMEAEDAIKITDIINAVSAEQAVSSYDISQGLTVASAAMATFGNSIEETTALLTAGTTIFQGRATQVARGLNMIATRVAKNEDALKKYGVSIYDSNGQLKSTYQILTELSPAWEEMSNAERVALGNTLAG